jgi:hypothetical protein
MSLHKKSTRWAILIFNHLRQTKAAPLPCRQSESKRLQILRYKEPMTKKIILLENLQREEDAARKEVEAV